MPQRGKPWLGRCSRLSAGQRHDDPLLPRGDEVPAARPESLPGTRRESAAGITDRRVATCHLEMDTALQFSLAEQAGMTRDKAELMLLDKRTRKARRTRYKLVVREMSAVSD